MKPVIIIAIAFVLLIPLPVFAPSHPEYVGFETPLKQIAQGIAPENVTCNKELVLIIRHNGSPACVKPQTAEKLEQRSWGVMPPPCCKNMHQVLEESISISSQELEESTNISSQECSGTARSITGTVSKIIDGDTIKVDAPSSMRLRDYFLVGSLSN